MGQGESDRGHGKETETWVRDRCGYETETRVRD